MLGRLIQGYAKGNQTLESATEEQHSRSLLWPQPNLEHVRGLGSSPPGTPIGSPTFRISQFDDRGGFELNDSKDVRIIIAQDAFGSMDKPMVLFDSQKRDSYATAQSPGSSAAGPILASPRTSRLQQSPDLDAHQRSRSTTISGPSSSWSRPAKEVDSGDRVGQLLDCMFGVTSATKSESSTKMHVLFSGRETNPIQAHGSPLSPVKTSARMPLIRSRNSIQATDSQRPIPSAKEDSSAPQDTVLITRMFSVNLPESTQHISHSDTPETTEIAQDGLFTPDASPSEPRGTGLGKKPKLVEKKTPSFAIGFLFYLPPGDLRTNLPRPPSRTSFASFSLPNSYSSDIASSWTLLEAIPESLASSQSQSRGNDRRVELITNIWDVILRSLSHVEKIARIEIRLLLQEVNREMMSSLIKAPKGPQEQRTNQRNIYIRNSFAMSHIAIIEQTCRHILRRICYALRIPRVITGLGFVDGHWLDEARYMVQVCGSKQHHFFLFNLLTAFLGNHTEWLERLGPDWYRKQFHALNKRHHSVTSLASRTVVISDRRSVARRLIFLLASFLPNRYGTNALEKDGTQSRSPLMTPGLGTSSPSDGTLSNATPQKSFRQRSRGQHVSFGTTDAIGLSTSASPTGSITLSNLAIKERNPRRKDSDAISIRSTSMLPIGSVHGGLQKTSATNSTITPNPATPVPYIFTNQESYFPEGVVAETTDSVASADLARILRRESSSYGQSSNPSTAWGSLISNMSGIWGKKGETTTESNPVTPSTTGISTTRRSESRLSTQLARQPQNNLESMVNEADNGAHFRSEDAQPQQNLISGVVKGSETNPLLEPPRLRVDDKDGVVDVDVGMQGFLSWAKNNDPLSPPSFLHKSPSIRSLDGVASIYSSKSYAPSLGEGSCPDGLNVAGFLKRYHEDFSLQAVRPYDELQDEIRQSMSRETTPLNTTRQARKAANEDRNGEWITICSTLVADLRKFSIERVTLQRRKLHRPASSTKMPRPLDSPTTKSHGSGSEERFVNETVGDFDTTLTDAIEGILGDSARQPAGIASKSSHKRTTSTSTTSTVLSNPPNVSFASNSRESVRKASAPRSDCRQVVAGALEEVVKSVNDDLNRHHQGRDIENQSAPDNQSAKEEWKQENVLREGVKMWLLNVETRSVW